MVFFTMVILLSTLRLPAQSIQLNNPSAGTILKASISVGTTACTTFSRVNPYARGLMLGYNGVMFILDANKTDPYKVLDDNLDKISW